MKKVPLEKVQARLAEYVEACARQSVIILSEGKPVAMLVGLENAGKKNPKKLRDILARAWEEYKEHGGMSHEQFWEGIDGPSPKTGSKKPVLRRAKKGSPKQTRPVDAA